MLLVQRETKIEREVIFIYFCIYKEKFSIYASNTFLPNAIQYMKIFFYYIDTERRKIIYETVHPGTLTISIA